MRDYYPIIYIRGYAMTSNEVENTFNLAYYGFNIGSTQFRQGAARDPEMHIFESPVIRLIKDHNYIDAYGRYVDRTGMPIPKSVAGVDDWRRTIWIYRYYDRESAMFGDQRPAFPHYAARLAAYLGRVREACGNPKDFKVNLVAHSMGGLIARCYLQGDNTKPYLDAEREVRKHEPAHLLEKRVKVNKLFTFATPHRGIAFRSTLGPVNWVREVLGNFREDQFTAKYMAQYLGPGATQKQPHGYKPRPHAPPLEKTFSLVGTNADDYTVRASRVSVGPKSDGLVLTENGYIFSGPRAYVHRSHSGPLGIVNSEEGYQNLQRFLFGNRRFQIRLKFGSICGQVSHVDDKSTLQFLLMDIAIALRGVGGFIDHRSEREMTAEPIELVKKSGVSEYQPKGEKDPVLFTGYVFMDPEARLNSQDKYSRWVLDLQVKPKYERMSKGLIFTSRSPFEGDNIINDRVEFGLSDTEKSEPFTYRWHGDGGHDQQPTRVDVPGRTQRFKVPLPQSAQRYFKNVHLQIDIDPWN